VNVRQIWRDRSVTGFYWPTQAFIAAWGLWNLYFYPALGQWFSFAGGVFLPLGNITWTLLAANYSSSSPQVPVWIRFVQGKEHAERLFGKHNTHCVKMVLI
jgi:hypothetical protein